jgi:hypothetical protein
MTKLKFLIGILLVVNTIFSQEKMVTGEVISNGNPLLGATISIAGTKQGTQTDELGKFSIKAKINDTLLISFLGKIDYKFKVENYNFISIDLKDSPQQIKEVYWQGQKKIKKRKITKPLMVIDGVAMDKNFDTEKELVKIINANDIDEVIAFPNPLYIINEIEYSEESLFSENPTSPYAPLDKQNITSTDILKAVDATKIYGQKGENGVVIITTKNGKPAEK